MTKNQKIKAKVGVRLMLECDLHTGEYGNNLYTGEYGIGWNRPTHSRSPIHSTRKVAVGGTIARKRLVVKCFQSLKFIISNKTQWRCCVPVDLNGAEVQLHPF